jgi:mRNA-degrading endonuclease RelE of RelBE toxin-antitoxin system
MATPHLWRHILTAGFAGIFLAGDSRLSGTVAMDRPFGAYRMQVLLSQRVKTALNTLASDDRERVNTWLGYLQNWEDDTFVRSRSAVLNVQGQPVYMFRTSTDVRIFYTVDEQTKVIRVIDVATTDTILSSGKTSAGV